LQEQKNDEFILAFGRGDLSMNKLLIWFRSILLKDMEVRVKRLEDSYQAVIKSLNTPQSHSGLCMCSSCGLLVARYEHQLDGSVICANCKR
jgi:hypothetical protein